MTSAMFPAGCFGKLPAFGDFVRHNASGREVLAFDQWLHQGIYHARTHLRQEWDAAFESAPAYEFLFVPENAGRFLVGVLQPSRDRSNRPYPFLISLLVDRPRFADDKAPMVPVLFSDFFENARRLAKRAIEGMDMHVLAAQTEKLSLPVEDLILSGSERYREYLETTHLGSFLGTVLGDFESGTKYLLFKNLTEIVIPFRQYNLARMKLGLRFPLSSEDDAAHKEACFWIQATVQLLGASSVVPVLFWTMNDQVPRSRHLFLFFRQPSASTYLQLVRPAIESDGICVLNEEGSESTSAIEQKVNSQWRDLLDNGDLPLREFLDRLKGAAEMVA